MAINLDWTPKTGATGETDVSVTTGVHTGNKDQQKVIRFKISDAIYTDLTVIKKAAEEGIALEYDTYNIEFNDTEATINGITNVTDLIISYASPNLSGKTINYNFVSGSVTKSGTMTLERTAQEFTIHLGTLNNDESHPFQLKLTGIPISTSTTVNQILIGFKTSTISAKVATIRQAAIPTPVINKTGTWKETIPAAGGKAIFNGSTNATVFVLGANADMQNPSGFANITGTLTVGNVSKAINLPVKFQDSDSITIKTGLNYDGTYRDMKFELNVPANTLFDNVLIMIQVTPRDNNNHAGSSVDITLDQDKLENITLSPESLTFAYNDTSEKTIEVTSNANWTSEITD